MGSTRLPGKVMFPLAGIPVVEHVVNRVRAATRVDMVLVATTTDMEDDALVAHCLVKNIPVFRGSSADVLSRYFHAAEEIGASDIIRVTSDCPFIDPTSIDGLVDAYQRTACDYMSNTTPGVRTFPRGLDCEIFSFDALHRAHAEARESYEREHVTPYIHENKANTFSIGDMLRARGVYARLYRLTLDYPEDYTLCELLYEKFYIPGEIIDVRKVLEYLDTHPEFVAINSFREAEYPVQGIRK